MGRLEAEQVTGMSAEELGKAISEMASELSDKEPEPYELPAVGDEPPLRMLKVKADRGMIHWEVDAEHGVFARRLYKAVTAGNKMAEYLKKGAHRTWNKAKGYFGYDFGGPAYEPTIHGVDVP